MIRVNSSGIISSDHKHEPIRNTTQATPTTREKKKEIDANSFKKQWLQTIKERRETKGECGKVNDRDLEREACREKQRETDRNKDTQRDERRGKRKES